MDYDFDCCSNSDCHPIDSCSELIELPDGRISFTDEDGDKFTFPKSGIHVSKDNKCHVCIHKMITWANGKSGYDKTPHCVYMHLGM